MLLRHYSVHPKMNSRKEQQKMAHIKPMPMPCISSNNKSSTDNECRRVFMVAEKRLLAEAIAQILSQNQCRKRGGWNRENWLFEFDGVFRDAPANFTLTHTRGHMMSEHTSQQRAADFCNDFKSWERNALELFDCPIEQKEVQPAHKMREFFASEASGCDFLVLWLDCDKEGENICFEVIDAVKGPMCRAKSWSEEEFMANRVFRARFSSITDNEIRAAMTALVKPNRNASLSVAVRQELDLRVGCAFTRFQTKFFRDMYCDFDDCLILFGPCQTPTLAFCVERHDQIERFKPQPYWELQAEVELLLCDGTSQSLTLEWCRGSQFDRAIAKACLDKVEKCTVATVSEVTTEEKQENKPEALRTVELLKMASSGMGLSPREAMVAAQNLYITGQISYPRTETSAYPDGFDFVRVLDRLKWSKKFWNIVEQILREGISKPRDGTNKGDHPPITPMKTVEDFSCKDHASLHEYIARHFLATLMRPCRYLLNTVSFEIGGEQFVIQFRRVVDPGFTTVLNSSEIAKNVTSLPTGALPIGRTLQIRELRMVEQTTVAPDHLTEAELITLMEQHGIGTDASIPVHIDNICVREYVKVESKRRQLVPTPLGIALVHSYEEVDPDLVRHTTRAEMERQLDLISMGEADFATMRKQTLELYQQKFLHFTKHFHLVENQILAALSDPDMLHRECAKCERFMLKKEALSRNNNNINTDEDQQQQQQQKLICPSCQRHQKMFWDDHRR